MTKSGALSKRKLLSLATMKITHSNADRIENSGQSIFPGQHRAQARLQLAG
jgi:hypothetical protein